VKDVYNYISVVWVLLQDFKLFVHTNLCAMPFMLMCAIPSNNWARRRVAIRMPSCFSRM